MSLSAGFVSIVTQRVSLSDSLSVSSEFKIFELAKPLPMKLESFVEHFLYQLSLPEEIIVTGFLLLEKLLDSVSSHNMHMLVFTVLALSYKFITDIPVSNSSLEKIFGFKLGILKKSESILLNAIQWKFNFSQQEQAMNTLLEAANSKECERFCNYSDEETNFTEQECGDENFSELGFFFSN